MRVGRVSRFVRFPLFTIPTVLLLSSSLFAQQFPSQQRGLSADTAFQLGEIDHVNLFNGALTIQIPIGQTYPVGPNLSYGLTLSYASNGWDYLEDQQCLAHGGGLDFWEEGIESRHNNVAFGWRIVPGKVVTRDTGAVRHTYVAPDGSERGFYDELHPGYGGDAGVWYSNDSTYLRMKFLPQSSCTLATGGSLPCYHIEFPNGAIHEFHDFDTGTEEEQEWLLTRIFDRFEADHYMEIDYSIPNQWNVSDSHGRTHTVTFSNGRIEEVELAAFDGTTSTYVFTAPTRTLVRRLLPAAPSCKHTMDQPPTTIDVPVLTQLTLPDTSAYRMDYYTSFGAGEILSGGIKSLRFPTGGEYTWEYQQIDFIFGDTSPFAEYVSTAFGVGKKELFTIAGNTGTKIGEWTYNYATHPSDPDIPEDPGDPGSGIPCFHRVTVTDPDLDETVHYFDAAQAFSVWQYALPFGSTPCRFAAATRPGLTRQVHPSFRRRSTTAVATRTTSSDRSTSTMAAMGATAASTRRRTIG